MAINLNLPEGFELENQNLPQDFELENTSKITRPNGLAANVINTVRGGVSGLEKAGLGIYQTAADLGAEFKPVKTILSKIRPDLANEIQSLTPSDISEALGRRIQEKRVQSEKEGTAFKIGEVTGEVAPFLGLGATSVPGLLTTGAIASGVSPLEQSGLKERTTEAGKGALTNLVVGKTLQGITKAIPTIKELPRRLLQKTAGVDNKLVEAFKDSGVSPRLADITSGAKTKVFQNLVEKFPGGGKPLEQAAQQQVDDITKQIARVTGGEGGTIQQTGKQIQEGAETFKNFATKRVANLYDKLDNFLPKESKISINNLNNLAKDPAIQDVVEVGAGDTAKVIKRLGQLVDDEGNIPYSRLKIFRSTIGNKLQSALSGDERSALKKIYGALSEDMKTAIINNSGEKGLQAFNKANNAFSRTQNFLDKNIEPLISAKTPEKVYQLALSGTKQGGSNIKSIIKTLDPSQKEYLRGTVLKQMGMASPGLQDATGEVFSPAKFLTEWNKLSPEAKINIFTKDQILATNKLNKVISAIKDSSKVKQFSNNLPYATWAGLGTISTLSPVTGLGLAGGARITSSMMANPEFVNWLSKTPNVKPSNFPKYLNRLSIIAAKDPSIRDDMLNYLESITIGSEETKQEQ